MEFEEFARRFRERAAKRMLEFEVALEQSRRDLERSDRERNMNAARGGVPRAEQAVSTHGEGIPGVTPAVPPRGRHSQEWHEPERRATRGPVRGVLKRN